LSVRNESNSVIAVIPENIQTVSNIVYWIQNVKFESGFGQLPLERYVIGRAIGFPVPINHYTNVRGLIRIIVSIANEHAEEFREGLEDYWDKYWIREFLSGLNSKYSNDTDVQELFRIPIFENLIDIQN